MFSRFVLAWAAFSLVVDEPAKEEPSFRTLCERLERAAHDDGLEIEWGGLRTAFAAPLRIDEGRSVVADERKFPFLKDRVLGRLFHGPPRGSVDFAKWRKIVLDLETGKFQGPEGGDLEGVPLRHIGLYSRLSRRGTNESCRVFLSQAFRPKHIAVSVQDENNANPAFERELAASLKSKLMFPISVFEAPAEEKRNFRTDLRTVCECLQRMARERGLSINRQVSVGGVSAENTRTG